MKKKIRVLFIVPYPSDGASNRLRVEQYLPCLDREGISCRVRPFVGRRFYRILYSRGRHLQKAFYFLIAIINRLLDILRSLRYDVVFIHREALPVGSTFIESAFYMLGKRIIFDFDDAIFLPNTSKINDYIERFKNPNKIARIITLSSHVVAGNGYLEEYARKFNKNVTVVPTPIDTGIYKPLQPENRRSETVTIGWIGSLTTRVYLDDIADVLTALTAKCRNVKLKFVGNWSGLERPIAGADYVEWSLDKEISEISLFDIGIMPMPDDMWTRGKCGFKILLYMACGIPVVSSPVGVNKEIIRDGENGFLASSGKEWEHKLSILVEDGALRKRFGLAGRETVEAHYSVARTSPAIINVIRGSLP